MAYAFEAIGYLRTTFKENFGIPRQSGLVPAAQAVLELQAPYNDPDGVRGLSDFSHVWIVFVFHSELDRKWSPLVRPPRLGGNEKRGVFASRAPVRPNPIGLSVVKLDAVHIASGSVQLRLSGGDFLDGTPVLDIKPYVPYADAQADAYGAYAHEPPKPVLRVAFSPLAQQQLQLLSERYPDLEQLLTQMLALDPRPAYIADRATRDTFAMRVVDFDVKWRVAAEEVTVVDIRSLL